MTRNVLYEVKGPKTLYEMSWVEAKDAFDKTDIAIIPIGSTEQHGHHLPLGSDSIQADDLARMVIEKCAKKEVVIVSAPTIPFGISHHHMKFPGSITLTSSTLSAVLWDVVQSLYQHGCRKYMLLLGHGGNYSTLRLCAQDFAADMPDCIFLAPDWLSIIYATYKDTLKSERWMDEHHSGEGETARMIVSTPKLVNLKKAKVYYSDSSVDPYLKPSYGGNPGKEDGSIGMKEVTSVGSMGNPKLATAETGEKLYEVAARWLSDVIIAELVKK